MWRTVDQQGAALFDTVRPFLGQVGNWLMARSAKIGTGMVELALSLVLVFFFYRDGPRLAVFMHSLLERLIGVRADHYLELVAGTVQRVVNGVIGTAAAQAVLAYIGFAIAGVPGALVLALLLDGGQTLRQQQLKLVARTLGPAQAQTMGELWPLCASLHAGLRLPLAALAFPALRGNPRPQLQQLVQAIDAMVQLDGELTLFEYCLARLLRCLRHSHNV